jgi:hypothetical protein
MKKPIIMLICLGILFIGTSSFAKTKYYRIKKNTEVLVFLGVPGSNEVIPVKYTTARDQNIKLFHKRSGPGIYAFYLEDLLIKDGSTEKVAKGQGYFLAKKRQLIYQKGMKEYIRRDNQH